MQSGWIGVLMRQFYLCCLGIALCSRPCCAQGAKPEADPHSSRAVKALFEEIGQAWEQKQWIHALELAERATQQAQSDQDIPGEYRAIFWRAESLFNIAGDLFNAGNVRGASEKYQAAYEAYLRQPSDTTKEPYQSDFLNRRVADCLCNIGVAFSILASSQEARTYFQRALNIYENLALHPQTDPSLNIDIADCQANLGRLSLLIGDLATAQKMWGEALKIRLQATQGAPDPDVAELLFNLGSVTRLRGDLKSSEVNFKSALTIEAKLPRDAAGERDLQEAQTLIHLALLFLQKGDIKEADRYQKQALGLSLFLSLKSVEAAKYLGILGNVFYLRGDLTKSEESFMQAKGIIQKLAPDSQLKSIYLYGLGTVMRETGRPDRAREYFEETLEVCRRLAPDSLDMAGSLSNLALLALDAGDAITAEIYNLQALEIRKRQAPDAMDTVMSLINLGGVYYVSGKPQQAADYYKQALIHLKRQSVRSLERAGCLENLGFIALDASQRSKAQIYFQDAYDLRKKLAPGSLAEAHSLYDISLILESHQDYRNAVHNLERALTLYQGQAPQNLMMARICHRLAILYRKSNSQRALILLERATNILQNQHDRLWGWEDRFIFTETNAAAFKDLTRMYLEQHRVDKALETIERLRARTLVERRAENFLLTNAADATEFPAALKPLLMQQRYLEDQDNAAFTLLQKRVDKKDVSLRVQTVQRLIRLNVQQARIESKIRRVSPHYADLAYPHPPKLREIKQGLPPGTLALVYTFEGKVCHLFTITHSSLRHYSLPLRTSSADKDLVWQVDTLRKLLTDIDMSGKYKGIASRLYERLIAPAQAEVSQAQRLILCPEGILYKVPFAALIHKRVGLRERYLIEENPLCVIPSLGLYLQMKREEARRGSLVKAGRVHPLYALISPGVPVLTKQDQAELDRLTHGKPLLPISTADAQLRDIWQTYGRAAVVRSDKKATKHSVLTESLQATVLHIGCHGLLDPQDPLSSCLVLHDSLFRFFDILKMKLSGPHVVLAACETALGGKYGELQSGTVLSLPWAFMYAGAHDVAASLWKVNQQSTAKLMAKLHKDLHAGKDMSEALWMAQIGMLQDPKWGHPGYWAGFLAYGLQTPSQAAKR